MRLWRILERETTSANLRLSAADLAKAKARARKMEKPHEALKKGVIHQSLA
jgi:hypothetical protein